MQVLAENCFYILQDKRSTKALYKNLINIFLGKPCTLFMVLPNIQVLKFVHPFKRALVETCKQIIIND